MSIHQNHKEGLSPVLVIVGPTASGKSALAVQMAKKYNGEIISADSRAIYKYVNIASAKPTEKEQSGIKHWGIDIVGPEDFNKISKSKDNIEIQTAPFTVADFKKYAQEKIIEIQNKGVLPIVVGGTGLYIDALIYDYKFDNLTKLNSKKVNEKELAKRQEFGQMTIDELQNYCNENNIIVNGNFNNKRHLARSIEKSVHTNRLTNDRGQIQSQYLVVGITTKKEELDIKIAQRIDAMLRADLEKEYEKIVKLYPKNSEVLKSNAYIVIEKYQNGEIEKIDLKNELIKLDKKLVKKQKTWFKRNEQIIWANLDQMPSIISGVFVQD